MSRKITFLSVGLAINDVLTKALAGKVTAVFPCAAASDAKMPYVEYARTGIYNNPTKTHPAPPYDSCNMDVSVYTAEYAEGVDLIEQVREALEGTRIEYTDPDDANRRLKVDCSRVIDCQEQAFIDGYLQRITISCKAY